MEYVLIFFLYTQDGRLIDKSQRVVASAAACYAEQRRRETRLGQVGFAVCRPR